MTPGFLYFIEGQNTAAADIIAAAGLAYALGDGTAITTREALAGPGPKNRGGIVLAYGGDGKTDPASVGFWPDRQVWRPAGQAGGTYVGMPAGPEAKTQKPGPADLMRAEPVGGYIVDLADGNPWIVPVARIFPEGTAFPQTLAIGPEGQLVSEPIEEFAAAAGDADRIWDAVRTDHDMLEDGEEPTAIDDIEAFRMAVRALAINYRVGPAEVSALKILTTTNVLRVLACFVDYPAFAAAELADAKKNGEQAPDTGPSDDGPPASAATTSQPEPTSNG